MDQNYPTGLTRYQPRPSRPSNGPAHAPPPPPPPQIIYHHQAPPPAAATEKPQIDLMQTLHRLLRGHYKAAFSLAVVGAMIGAFLGYRLNPPEYKSEGAIRIAYSLPLGTTTAKEQMPMTLFDAFIRAEQVEITSRTVIDQAMEDPAWKAVERPKTPDELRKFAENLSTEHVASSDLLYIHFVDTDPQAAAAAVQSVLNVYSKIFYQKEDSLNEKLIKGLTEEEAIKNKNLQGLQAQISEEDGGGNVQAQLDASQLTISSLTSKLNEAKYLLKLAQAQAQSDTGTPNDSANNLAGDQVVANDPIFRDYLASRQKIEAQLRTYKKDGYLDSHQAVKAARDQLTDIDTLINKYADDKRNSISATEAQLEQARGEQSDLNKKKTKIASLQAQADKVNTEVIDTENSIESIQVQAHTGSRMTILNDGVDVPVVPLKDRRLLGAAAGAGGGAAILLSLLLLTRLARPRYWTSDEAKQDVAGDGKIPLLGILPTLTDRAAALNQAGTAHCIHQMRVMLEVVQHDHPPAFLMTSSAPGEGKTGLTAALALSFALSGSRTLVIDADLMGRGLTSGHNADNEPGLCEALIEGTLNGFARETTTAGLWLLPAGQTGGDGAARLSAVPVQRILEEARQNFDVILIDSGPILGSVEASVISQKVDGVVFVVSRGQQRPLVKRALAQLRLVGAHMSGVVFNRADTKEFSKVAYMSSVRTRPDQGARGMTSEALPRATRAHKPAPTAAAARTVTPPGGDFGPLAQSVNNFGPVESANA